MKKHMNILQIILLTLFALIVFVSLSLYFFKEVNLAPRQSTTKVSSSDFCGKTSEELNLYLKGKDPKKLDVSSVDCITKSFAYVLPDCLHDINHDGQVDSADLAQLLGAWGPNPSSPFDYNNDGQVDSADLAQLLGAWGPCQNQCADEIDNDEDVVFDATDPGCWDEISDPNSYNPLLTNEAAATTQCQDEIDNDNDGFIDYPYDANCKSPYDNEEISSGASNLQNRVFVATRALFGSIGSIQNADNLCQKIANDFLIDGTWKAWISDSTQSVSQRFFHSNGQYKLLNNLVIANNWNDITDGTIQTPINIAENSEIITGTNKVWTGTLANGLSHASNCNSWTDSTTLISGSHGDITKSDSGWTSQSLASCSNLNHLYCFEQPGSYVCGDNICDVDEYCQEDCQSQWVEEEKITASDAIQDSDYFGQSVSVSGNIAIAGAKYDDLGSLSNTGAAYIFRYNGNDWVEEAKLTASNAAASDYFGFSVSIDENVAVVGTSLGNKAYVFRYDGNDWIEEDILISSDIASGDFFGESVDILGNLIVIGAKGEDNGGQCPIACNYGAAYIFRYNGNDWIEEAKLTASDRETLDQFGFSVSIDETVAVIGTYNSESAYVFRYDGTDWVQEDILIPSDAPVVDNAFGRAVSISGDVVAIGAENDDDSCIEQTSNCNAGAVYVFRYDGTDWIEEEKLKTEDVSGLGYSMGESVSVYGEKIVAGAVGYGFPSSSLKSGAAYIFKYENNNWILEDLIVAQDSATNDWFGRDVDISGDVIIAGADGEDNGQSGIFTSGAAYLFRYGEWE